MKVFLGCRVLLYLFGRSGLLRDSLINNRWLWSVLD